MHLCRPWIVKNRGRRRVISGFQHVLPDSGEFFPFPTTFRRYQVESVLYSHPAVNEAAVVARPDEFWGETPCAFLSLKPGTGRDPTEKEVVEFCKAKMPHYMAPKTVVFKDELPKTSTGKIQKFILREIAKSMGPMRSRM